MKPYQDYSYYPIVYITSGLIRCFQAVKMSFALCHSSWYGMMYIFKLIRVYPRYAYFAHTTILFIVGYSMMIYHRLKWSLLNKKHVHIQNNTILIFLIISVTSLIELSKIIFIFELICRILKLAFCLLRNIFTSKARITVRWCYRLLGV